MALQVAPFGQPIYRLDPNAANAPSDTVRRTILPGLVIVGPGSETWPIEGQSAELFGVRVDSARTALALYLALIVLLIAIIYMVLKPARTSRRGRRR